jgi:hypothetical protein
MYADNESTNAQQSICKSMAEVLPLNDKSSTTKQVRQQSYKFHAFANALDVVRNIKPKLNCLFYERSAANRWP